MLILLNCYYCYHYLNIWYGYQFTDIQYFFVMPMWEIVMNLIVGLIGIVLGNMVWQESMSIVKGLSGSGVLILISQIVGAVL